MMYLRIPKVGEFCLFTKRIEYKFVSLDLNINKKILLFEFQLL